MRDISSPLDGIASPFGPQRTKTLTQLLFASNEPGFTFEPWDITTLYQDRAGTTPVTAAGQSVGLRLDKSKGLVLGPELVTNGDFATDTGWTLGGNWSISGGTLNGAAATSYSYIQAIGLNPSKTYRLLVSVTVSIGSVAINLGGINEVAFTSSGQKTATLLLDPSAIPFVYVSGSNFTGTIDNISVRELAGNHEVAISDAKRGVYGWMPKTGKRNLLTYTEQFDNAAWASVGSTTRGAASVTSANATSVQGFARSTTFTSTAGTAYTESFEVKNNGVRYVQLLWDVGVSTNFANFDLNTGEVTAGTYLGATITPALDGYWRITMSSTLSASAFAQVFLLFVDSGSASRAASYTGSGTDGIFIRKAQLEASSTATAYQRVASQYDITEAGVPTCYYVQADGVDDAYVTPTITPNTDKAQVFAGVRKLSGSAGIIIESSSIAPSNSGALFLGSAVYAAGDYAVLGGGTSFYVRNYVTFNAPVTNVLTAQLDNGGVTIADEVSLRANGALATVGGTSAGGGVTGNFLAYPLYIYGRAGTSLPFNGLDFGHAVRFGPNLDAATIARVEALIARNTPEVTL